jgi:hypothetical protein
LPSGIREQLNSRMAEGETGRDLAAWLNSLAEVKAVLKEHFQDQPINEPNLTEWRQGGFRDWQCHLDTKALVREMMYQASDFFVETDGEGAAEQLANVLAGRLCQTAVCLLDSDEALDTETRWKRMREVLHEVARLRWCDIECRRVRGQNDARDDAWARQRRKDELEEQERQRLAKERESREWKDRHWAMYNAALNVDALAQKLGGTPRAVDAARSLLEMENDLPLGFLTNAGTTASVRDFTEFVFGGKPEVAAARLADAKAELAKRETIVKEATARMNAARPADSYDPQHQTPAAEKLDQIRPWAVGGIQTGRGKRPEIEYHPPA